MTTVSIPRLRSVRFKDGRASLHVFRTVERKSDVMERFVESSREIAELRGDMAGYIMVAWSADGGTSVSCRTLGAPIPIMLLPEFTKTCVLDWLCSNSVPA